MRFTKLPADLRVEFVALLPPFRAHLTFDDTVEPKIEDPLICSSIVTIPLATSFSCDRLYGELGHETNDHEHF